MKKFLSLILLLAAVAGTANADNYFTLRADDAISVNDTLWFNPSAAGFNHQFYAVAHFDGYLDHWYLKITHPLNMGIHDDPLQPESTTVEGSAMYVPYINSAGDSAVHHAYLLTQSVNNPTDTTYESFLSSTISIYGYWDQYNNGNYEPYGTVKWGPGTHDYMFRFSFEIPQFMMDADVILDATLTSTLDWRGVWTVNLLHAIKTVHIHLGYQKGDVSGDGVLTISDVTLLIDYLSDAVTLDPYQLAAADVNGDGLVTIADVTALGDIVLAPNN